MVAQFSTGILAHFSISIYTYTPKGKSTPITVIMTDVPDSVPISTPHCQGFQPPKPKSPSLSGKNVNISITSVLTTCSLMKIQMNSWYGSVKNCV
ncbi:hypothetical protein, partial [Phocaeicola vulgatus]|uniref:hypothetical protein n=1 Tax=Phocaeicola vulgatus TaxID=821 RepID=UPI001C881EB1